MHLLLASPPRVLILLLCEGRAVLDAPQPRAWAESTMWGFCWRTVPWDALGRTITPLDKDHHKDLKTNKKPQAFNDFSVNEERFILSYYFISPRTKLSQSRNKWSRLSSHDVLYISAFIGVHVFKRSTVAHLKHFRYHTVTLYSVLF